MERDVRAAEQPVTQRFCAINTSCSPGVAEVAAHRRATHTHTHTHTHTLCKHPTAWSEAKTPACAADISAAAALAECLRMVPVNSASY